MRPTQSSLKYSAFIIISTVLFSITLGCGNRENSPAKAPLEQQVTESHGETQPPPDPDYDAEKDSVIGTLKQLDNNAADVWAEKDIEFYLHWQKGLEHEDAGLYNDAAESYRQALGVERYEISSYEALLPLGRVLLKNNQYQEAQETLASFIQQASAELSGEAVMLWGLSEEGQKLLEAKVNYAERLLEQASTTTQ